MSFTPPVDETHDVPTDSGSATTRRSLFSKKSPVNWVLYLKRSLQFCGAVSFFCAIGIVVSIWHQVSELTIRVNSIEAAFRSGQFSQLPASVANLEKQVAEQEQRFAGKNDVTAGMKTLAEQVSAQADKNQQLSRELTDDRQDILRQEGQLATLQSDIDGAKTRIQALVDQRERTEKAAPVSAHTSAETPKTNRSSTKKSLRSARIVPPAAPFILTGIERRGGQTYAVVAPKGATSLSDMQLLAPGDSAWGWTLSSAQGNEALFSVNGIQQRLTAQ